MRFSGSSKTWRDMAPHCVVEFEQWIVLLLVRGLRVLLKLFEALDDAVHQRCRSAPAGHALCKVLVEHGAERLPRAPAVEHVRVPRALAHHLEHRAEERLRDEDLRLPRERVVRVV